MADTTTQGKVDDWIRDEWMPGLDTVRGEFSLTALAYNMRRAINLVGIATMIAAAAG